MSASEPQRVPRPVAGSGTVLITDVVWPDIEVERAVLAAGGLTPVLAPSGDEDVLVELAAGSDGIITCFALVTERVIAANPALGIVSRTGVGLDNIDVAACEARSIPVTRVPDYCIDEVATHTVATALSLWRRLPAYHAAALAGRWGTDPAGLPLRRLAGRRVAVIGRGPIGAEVSRRWEALGTEVTDDVAGADIVCLHLPLRPETDRWLDADRLAALAPGAVVVNTARGGVLDLDAAVAALEAGQLSGLGLDVFPTEPWPVPPALAERTDVVLTPHVAFYSEEALVELRTRAAQHVVDAIGR